MQTKDLPKIKNNFRSRNSLSLSLSLSLSISLSKYIYGVKFCKLKNTLHTRKKDLSKPLDSETVLLSKNEQKTLISPILSKELKKKTRGPYRTFLSILIECPTYSVHLTGFILP